MLFDTSRLRGIGNVIVWRLDFNLRCGGAYTATVAKVGVILLLCWGEGGEGSVRVGRVGLEWSGWITGCEVSVEVVRMGVKQV